MTAAYLRSPSASNAAQEAIGALEAQRAVDGTSAGGLTPPHAWLAFCQLAAVHGWKSAACRALVVEFAKRAAAR